MKFDLFELEFVDKNRKLVTTEEWLAGKEATWELKHRFLAMPILWFLFIMFFLVWLMTVIILFFTDNCWYKKNLY